MPGNSFGQAFRITTAGESHGPANVVIVDGVPPGIVLDVEDLRRDLVRRRPGQSHLVTQRNEADEPEILSGVFDGKTTGTSIAIVVRNSDQKSKDYSDIGTSIGPGTPTTPTTRNTVFGTTVAAVARVRAKRWHAWPRAPLQRR